MKVALATLVATLGANASSGFDAYKAKFGKTYSSPTVEATAEACWKDNFEDLISKNAAAREVGSNVIFAENVFSDQCFKDFAAQRMNQDQSNGLCTGSGGQSYPTPADKSKSMDWRSKGYVNPIKDQGSCGSCWAFSAVGALEGAHFRASGELLSFAEQDLVSCDKSDGNNGCNGGMPGEAFAWVAANGISLEKDYPYTAKDDACQTKHKSLAKFSGFTYYDTTSSGGGEDMLLAVLQNEGPVSITVNANSWHQYSGGIMPAGSCESGWGINHAVLAVGYGEADGKGYYIVRNSWGHRWGEDGYIRFAFGEGACAIQSCFSAVPMGVKPATIV